jgi:hypothetical protein
MTLNLMLDRLIEFADNFAHMKLQSCGTVEIVSQYETKKRSKETWIALMLVRRAMNS